MVRHRAAAQQQQRGRRRQAAAAAASGGQANTFVGSLRADGLRFGVVVARFNELVTKLLLEGVLEGVERHGGQRSDVDVRGPHLRFPLLRAFCTPAVVPLHAASLTGILLLAHVHATCRAHHTLLCTCLLHPCCDPPACSIIDLRLAHSCACDLPCLPHPALHLPPRTFRDIAMLFAKLASGWNACVFPGDQVAWVPGSFELPVLAAAMAKSGQYDAVITVGAVVRIQCNTCIPKASAT